MPNYQEGKIYTIRNYNDDTMIYVGSTIATLPRRIAEHRSKCKAGKKNSLYSHIDNNDWSCWYIELYEYYPCNNRTELEKREGEVIRLIGSINKNITGQTIKEWKEKNADKIKEYRKNYKEENADKIKEKTRCNICSVFIRKDNIMRHQKTIKCTIANNLILPIIR